MSLVINLAAHLTAKNKINLIPPQLLYILRDFALQLSDTYNNPITES